VKFDHIGFSDQPEPKRTQGHTEFQVNIFSGLRPPRVGTFVHNPALGHVSIFVPLLLDMDQCTLPLAKKQVLKGGKG
jgi:hypothetical protein